MTKKIVFALFVLGLAFWPRASAFGANTSGRLDETVQDYRVSESNFARALMLIASQYDIYMGIEWIEPVGDQPVDISGKSATVRQIIESIVKSRPGYIIRVINGRVHISYQGAELDRKNFLNLRLPSFKIQQKHIAVALFDLTHSVMRDVSPENQCCVFREIMLEPNDHLISEEFQDSTVRDILDDLTFQSDSKVWVVTFPLRAGTTPTGYRRTCSLWNNYPIPDNDQPIWDRFRWGMRLPAPPTSKPGIEPTQAKPK